MELMRMHVVRLGYGCRIDGTVVFDCGELLLNCQYVVVGS